MAKEEQNRWKTGASSHTQLSDAEYIYRSINNEPWLKHLPFTSSRHPSSPLEMREKRGIAKKIVFGKWKQNMPFPEHRKGSGYRVTFFLLTIRFLPSKLLLLSINIIGNSSFIWYTNFLKTLNYRIYFDCIELCITAKTFFAWGSYCIPTTIEKPINF